MKDRILVVARLKTSAADEVAQLFATSDSTELPHALGVTRRHLFSYRGLYFHYAEFIDDAGKALAVAREREDFQQLSEDLSAYVAPFDPCTSRSPADAMAQEFYSWAPDAPLGAHL
jgi:hypothetical protein